MQELNLENEQSAQNITKPSFSYSFFSQVNLNLLIASFLGLFIEVMLIRWLPSYERVLAYYTNFVLIAAFLGLGLGSMLSRWRRDLIRYQAPLMLGLVVVAIIFNQYLKTGAPSDDVIYTSSARAYRFGIPLHLTLAFFYLLVAAVLMPIGQTIGKELRQIKRPLTGYTLNILGSLLGVLVFSAISFLQVSPQWWFVIALGLLLWFVRSDRGMFWVNTCASVLTVIFVWGIGSGFVWSPYHRIVTSPLVIGEDGKNLRPFLEVANRSSEIELPPDVGLHIAVDEDFLQMALNLSPESVTARPFLQNYQIHYDLAYQIPEFSHDRVLIVGAGTGNDTAAALRNGAKEVHAVEIDPALVTLGKQYHPEKPYQDPRVHVHVDDARSYFNKTTDKFDLVVFGLLDAHKLFSSMSSVRLDSFVFTIESLREVRGLLNDHGVVFLQHGLGASFMANRMYHMMEDAFEQKPHIIQIPEFPGLTYIAGPGVEQFLGAAPSIEVPFAEKSTDDWPFFYLAGRSLPREYWMALCVMLFISITGVCACTGGRLRSVNLHFFFLGSAFLLIETVCVTRFAMLFGSTWVVNSIVFSAILLVILLANIWMEKVAINRLGSLYAMLFISVLVNYLFPLGKLLELGIALRLAGAMLLLGIPIFFAALIFAHSFKQTTNPELAFASNLVGAVVGGLTEYSTLIFGFKNQLLIGLGFYVLSYLTLVLSIHKKPFVSVVPSDPSCATC